MVKVYTKTGDKGITSLFSGERLPKSDTIFHILGLIDVLQVHIGMIASDIFQDRPDIQLELRSIQSTLIRISSMIATTPGGRHVVEDIKDDTILHSIETSIDSMTEELPPLTRFILVGTSLENGFIHQCRTSTRTVERALYDTTNLRLNVTPFVAKYINRLSDYFFTLARYHTYLRNELEIVA